jgi:ankyrin repeat protein
MDAAGSAAFVAAARYGKLAETEAILATTVKKIKLLSACDTEGYTAIDLAAIHGHTTIVAALLRAGASPNFPEYV